MDPDKQRGLSKKVWTDPYVKNIRYLAILGLLTMGRAIWDTVATDRVTELGPVFVFLAGLFMLQQYRLRAELVAMQMRDKEK